MNRGCTCRYRFPRKMVDGSVGVTFPSPRFIQRDPVASFKRYLVIRVLIATTWQAVRSGRGSFRATPRYLHFRRHRLVKFPRCRLHRQIPLQLPLPVITHSLIQARPKRYTRLPANLRVPARVRNTCELCMCVRALLSKLGMCLV